VKRKVTGSFAKRLIVPAMWAVAAYLLIGKVSGLFNSRWGLVAALAPVLPFLVFLSLGNVRLWRAPALSSEQEAALARSLLTRDPRMRSQAQRAGLVASFGIWCGVLAALIEGVWGASPGGRIIGSTLIAMFCLGVVLTLTTALKGWPRFLLPPRLRGRSLYE
jgi:hypothetical protein